MGLRFKEIAMDDRECEFCCDLNNAMETERRLSRGGFQTEYFACFVGITTRDGYIQGRHTGRRHPLNFCPVCGKPIEVTTVVVDKKENPDG